MFPQVPADSLPRIAEAVQALSDFYIRHPEGETPWGEAFCRTAYRHYFLPLNFTRAQLVITRGLQVGFFHGLRRFVDWGAGPGTASMALAANAEIRPQINSQLLFDHSAPALETFRDLHSSLVQPQVTTRLNLQDLPAPAETALVFSYSLTELPDLPAGWNRFEALMILEPSTSQDGRRLMALRERLMAEGYHIWAPCVHPQACPLLTHSKQDWCHDRTAVQAPEWFQRLEQLLPMRNRTVTVSYLLARRTLPPAFLRRQARLTGDSLEEKGKTRQLVCRGDQREFLTWMHKTLKPQTLARGELIRLPAVEEMDLRANELRLKRPLAE